MSQKLAMGEEKLPRTKLWSTGTMVKMAMFIAISGVGAMIKIPSPTGTVALDSAAAYYAALALGYKQAAIIAIFGHLFSGLTVGFTLTLPLHLLIAAQMAFYVMAFRWLSKQVNLVVGVVGATLLNGILAPAIFIPLFGTGFFFAMVIPLLVASFINILLAAIVHLKLSKGA